MFVLDDDKDASADTSGNDADTSEDTEDTPDDNEESDDSNEDVDGDGEESDAEDDISNKYFTDPNSLPKELRGAFKKMQGVFTRKMQNASVVIKQAQAFNLLRENPEFQKWVEQQSNGNKGGGTNKSSDANDDDTPLTKKDLEAFMKSFTNRQAIQEQFKAEATAFKKDYPDWEIYKDEMKSIMEDNPRLSYVQAYKLARADEDAEETNKRLTATKKRANVNKPNRIGAKQPVKKGKMSLLDAFNLAKKSHNT